MFPNRICGCPLLSFTLLSFIVAKRDAAMKDSGRGAPGFGGYLDLLDAVILAAPVAFLLALAF